ncbi:conserved hypothetical protein [Prochlorococcus marinus str. MIT 9202]|nr:conserved hypothetical protein [Prochlorococcus marinus str. MIT 9202]
MKLAVIFLPIIFAIIWMLLIGLNINKLNKKLIINCLKTRNPSRNSNYQRGY